MNLNGSPRKKPFANVTDKTKKIPFITIVGHIARILIELLAILAIFECV